MAQFNITITDNGSRVVPKPIVETDCSTTYEYDIYANVDDSIDITLLGDHELGSYTLDGIEYSISNSVLAIKMGTTLTCKFVLQNSNVPGIFPSTIITIDNTTLVGFELFEETVTRLDDSPRCESTGLPPVFPEESVVFITEDFTLPDSTTFDDIVIVKNVHTDELKVNTVGSDLLEGQASTIIYPDESFTIKRYEDKDYRII